MQKFIYLFLGGLEYSLNNLSLLILQVFILEELKVIDVCFLLGIARKIY